MQMCASLHQRMRVSFEPKNVVKLLVTRKDLKLPWDEFSGLMLEKINVPLVMLNFVHSYNDWSRYRTIHPTQSSGLKSRRCSPMKHLDTAKVAHKPELALKHKKNCIYTVYALKRHKSIDTIKIGE